MVYWFATIMDAERIDREVRDVNVIDEAALGAVGFHDPERLWRARAEALARLQTRVGWSEDDLIAYALRRQAEVRGLVS